MALACQRDSYLQSLTTTVVSCMPAGDAGFFDVVLADTVLFPEGGGQPDDRGTIAGRKVLGVRRPGHAGDVVHRVQADEPLTAGEAVEVLVDWVRRWDHMQQHSAQHLISALAQRDHAMATVGWSLGADRSYIDFGVGKASAEVVQSLEEAANAAIRANTSVTPVLVEPGNPLLEKAHGRGLPDNLGGPLRVVDMEGIDANLCCGTHVQRLGHLQAIKLLHSETVKGAVRIHFVAGGRVLRVLGEAAERERQLTRVLTMPAEDHVAEVTRLKKAERAAAKANKDYLKEIAELQARQALAAASNVIVHHREDGDLEYAAAFCSALGDAAVLTLVTCGEDAQGVFLLSGPEDAVARLGPQVATILDGKGGGRKGRYQGKVARLGARAEAAALVQGEAPKKA